MLRDVQVTLTILLYWSMIESGLAVIAACLPTLHKFVSTSSIKLTLSRARSFVTFSSDRSQDDCRHLKDNEHSELTDGTFSSYPSNRDKFEANGICLQVPAYRTDLEQREPA